jgi:hypothetical protein
MNILDELQQTHGSEIQRVLTQQLGLSPQQAAGALNKVGPLILGALKRDKDLRGEDHVAGKVQQFGSVDLSDPGATMSGAHAGDTDLGGLLGGKGNQASQQLAQHLGISTGTAMKIIPMLAPLIIGMLMKKGGGVPGGTPGTGGGGGLGGLASILDRDGDGQILDDLGALFGGGPGSNKAGCLSAILGGMLNKK